MSSDSDSNSDTEPAPAAKVVAAAAPPTKVCISSPPPPPKNPDCRFPLSGRWMLVQPGVLDGTESTMKVCDGTTKSQLITRALPQHRRMYVKCMWRPRSRHFISVPEKAARHAFRVWGINRVVRSSIMTKRCKVRHLPTDRQERSAVSTFIHSRLKAVYSYRRYAVGGAASRAQCPLFVLLARFGIERSPAFIGFTDYSRAGCFWGHRVESV